MSVLKNIKTLWVIIIILIVLNLLSLGAFWMGKGHRYHDKQGKRDKTEKKYDRKDKSKSHYLARKLDFTEAQKKTFDSLNTIHREQLNLKTDEMLALRKELVGKMKNEEFDASADSLIIRIGEKQAELEQLNFDNFQRVMSICNDEQKEKFVNIMEKAFNPRYDKSGRHRGKGRKGRGRGD